MNEYFVPALIAIILSALIFFFVLPRLSPYILGGLAIAMLGLGIWQHYSMFPYEYRTSIVTELLQQYAGFIMLVLLILASIIGILIAHGTELPVVSEVIPEMPAMPNFLPTNNSTKNNSAKNVFNFGGNESKANTGILAAPVAAANAAANAVTNAVSNVYNGLMNSGKNNFKKNNLASPSFKVV